MKLDTIKSAHETWILRAISRVTHAIRGSEMEETWTSYVLYGPNIFLELYVDICRASVKFHDFSRLFVYY
jgi:hypothetical protein